MVDLVPQLRVACEWQGIEFNRGGKGGRELAPTWHADPGYLQGAASHIGMQFKRKLPLPCRTQYFPVELRQQQLKWGSKGRDGLLPHSCHHGAWTSGGYPWAKVCEPDSSDRTKASIMGRIAK